MKKYVCILLAGMLLLSLTACKKEAITETIPQLQTDPIQPTALPEIPEKSPKEKALSAYKAFLKGGQGAKQTDGKELFIKDYAYADNGGIDFYAYHDVSGDGVPELFIHSAHTFILSYQADALVQWYESVSWQPLFLLEKGGVLDVHHNMGSYYRYLTFNAKGVDYDIPFSEPAGQPEGKWHFQGGTVTQAQWEALAKPYLSQAQLSPDWQQWYGKTLSQLPEAYREILYNEKNLCLLGYGKMFLSTYFLRFPESGSKDISIAQLTTPDGKEMVAVQRFEDTLILYQSGGTVYGKRYNFRGMYDLCADGVYNWTNTDAEGLHYGTNRLDFQKGSFADVELYHIDQPENGASQFTLLGKASTAEEIQSYNDGLDRTEVTWTVLAGYLNNEV